MQETTNQFLRFINRSKEFLLTLGKGDENQGFKHLNGILSADTFGSRYIKSGRDLSESDSLLEFRSNLYKEYIKVVQ